MGFSGSSIPGRALSGSDVPASPEIREQLEKLLASPVFARSERLSRFLRFTIEHALAGTGDQLKEYLVGVEVFDRKATYDPRLDPIVRVEARRLRSKLKQYYASDGNHDAVTIEFPKGAYAPTFRARGGPPRAGWPESAQTSIAVLPFANLTPLAGDDYFSDGLAEELILLLTRVPGLRVVAWHSASQLRGRDQDLHGIQEQLKVGFVLTGGVRRTAARVRVTAQLIDTASGAYLWSEAYHRDMHNVFVIQEEIARAIVDTLRLNLEPPSPRVATRPVPNLECYNLCLQGRFHAHKRSADGLQKSAACYRQAIEKDPNAALAHAGASEAYCLLADYGLMHPKETIPLARAAALRALELDPDSAEANHSLAIIRQFADWQWGEAETLHRRAIALNPGYASARHWFALDFLGMLGRFDEAIPEIHLACQLDPLSLIIHEGVGYLHMLHRDYSKALDAHVRILTLDPSYYKAYSSIARVLSLQQRYDEAIAMFEKAQSLAGELPSILGALGQTLALAGRPDAARACLDQLNGLARNRYVASTCFAIIHLGLGEIDQCLSWMETACEQREFPVMGVGVHPIYDPLRSEPRFQTILRRIGFLQ